MIYTKQNYEAQKRFVLSALATETALLARVPSLALDVQANHERTIRMRIAYYEKRIAELDARIAAFD